MYKVPLTKEDVFADPSLSLIDKRRAMKLYERLQVDCDGTLDDLVQEV